MLRPWPCCSSSLLRRLRARRRGYRSDPPPGRFPIGRAKLALEDLARILARQFADQFEAPRYLVACNIPAQRVGEARGRELLPFDRLDHRHHRLSIFRSEEHTSELQSLMRISYAVFCLKKKKENNTTQ